MKKKLILENFSLQFCQLCNEKTTLQRYCTQPSPINGEGYKTLAWQAFYSLSPDGERAGDRGIIGTE